MTLMETKLLGTERLDALKVAVREAVDLLNAGEVVALPTETVYGLAGDAFNPEAVARIFAAKERPSFDPLILHLPHRDWLARVAVVPEDIAEAVDRVTKEFWPGPLTLVLPKHPDVLDAVTGGLNTVAVRMSSHPVFQRIVTSLGRPLAAPSANRFGRITPTSSGAVLKELGGRIPLVVDAGASHAGLESTIMRIEATVPGKKPIFRILRAGPLAREELLPFGKIAYANVDHVSERPEAPGQLAGHYAPQTPLRLVLEPSDFVPVEGRRYALLSYRGDEEDGYLPLTEWVTTLVLSPGDGKLPEAGVRFFHCLRQLDEAGVDEIIAEPVPERGVGHAIMERLRRASHAH
jgi:L-threonylcarbamoyladenylate synthase